LKIETFDRDDHQKLITAEIDPEAMEQFKVQAARKISSQAKIPGFRPGKVPYDIVRRTYGDRAIQEEALTIMLEKIYPDVIKEAGITPYGPGQLQEMLQVDPPKFSFIVPLAPVVELGDYKSIRKEHVNPVITDEKIDDVLRRLQRRSAVSQTVDRPAAEGDLVNLTISAKLATPIEDADPVLIPEGVRQMIAGDPRDFTDEDGNEWPFTGFSAHLLGVTAGEEKTIEYTFPDNSSNDDLNGKEAVFNLKVNTVSSLELHPLDDEFAQSIDSSYENLEALRKGIRDSMQSEETNRYNNSYMESLIEMVVKDATVQYPPVALQDEIDHVISHFEENLNRDQMDLETYLKTRQTTREDFIEKEVKPVAERNLKRNLVLEEFSIRENIQITPEEVQMIRNMAENQARQDPSLKNLARGGVSKQQVADNVARSTINQVFNQRMMNRLRDIAAGKADAPAVEEGPETVDAAAEPVVETAEAEPAADVIDNVSEEPTQAAE